MVVNLNVRNLVATFSLALAVLLLAATAVRVARNHQTPGPYNPAKQGFIDFQNGVYFPSKAFVQRVSPYSQQYAKDFPVPRSSPFFSPIAFAAHAPWAWLPLSLAEVLYFAWMVFLIATISTLITCWLVESNFGPSNNQFGFRWDLFGCIALAIVFSRGGHQTLFTGYFTFELILASLVAVQYGKTRPWLSALALIVVSFKPNYVVPLGILMLSRGNYRAVLGGGLLSAALAAICFGWILPDGGPKELIDQISMTQEVHHADENERPVNTWIRVDAGAVVAKWLQYDPNDWQYLALMLILLVPVALLLHVYHRRFPEDSGSVVTLSGGLLLLTSIVSIYHHVYDVLLLMGFVAAVALNIRLLPGEPPLRASNGLATKIGRYALALALFVPSLNYFSSEKLLNAFHIQGVLFQWVTSINAVTLLVVWLVLVFLLAIRAWSRGERKISFLQVLGNT